MRLGDAATEGMDGIIEAIVFSLQVGPALGWRLLVAGAVWLIVRFVRYAIKRRRTSSV
jgi:hypothetical protein